MSDLFRLCCIRKKNYLFGQIQTSQTGGQSFSDTSHFKVSQCSLDNAAMFGERENIRPVNGRPHRGRQNNFLLELVNLANIKNKN